MIVCPQCGTQHLPNTLFCDQCGQALFNSVEEVAGQTPARRSPPVSFQLRFEIQHTGRIETLPLTDGILIGRMDTETAPRPDLDLGDVGELALSISRHHARIRLIGAHAKIEDLGSTNGTSFQGRPLRPHQPATMPEGELCRLQVGAVRMTVRLMRGS